MTALQDARAEALARVCSRCGGWFTPRHGRHFLKDGDVFCGGCIEKLRLYAPMIIIRKRTA